MHTTLQILHTNRSSLCICTVLRLEPICYTRLLWWWLMQQVSVAMEAEPLEVQKVNRNTLGMQATNPEQHTGAAFFRLYI
jgi:hypothetical protein